MKASVIGGREVNRVRGRWLATRVTRALRVAGYWQSVGDLAEASRAAHRALRLAHTHGAVPATLVAEAALTVARIAQDGDDLARSRVHLNHAVDLLEAAPSDAERDRVLAWALVGSGDEHRRRGEYPAARRVLDRALRLVDRLEPRDARLHAAVLTSRGITAKESGDFGTAARCYAQVAGLLAGSGASSADAATLEHNLAGLDYARGRYPEAERHARQAVALRGRVAPLVLAPDLAVLASAVAAQGRYDEARTLLRRTLAAYRAARPPRRYEIAVQLHNLASVSQAGGDLAEAEDLYRQALALKEDLLGSDHHEVALVVNNLGTLLREQHRWPEADECFRRALAIAERTYRPGHPVLERIRNNRDHGQIVVS